MLHAVRTVQAAQRRRQLNRRVASRSQARLAREAAEAAIEADRRQREEGFDALKLQYGVTQLQDVRAALACYGPRREELGGADPEVVRAALWLIGEVGAASGTMGVGRGSVCVRDRF